MPTCPPRSASSKASTAGHRGLRRARGRQRPAALHRRGATAGVPGAARGRPAALPRPVPSARTGRCQAVPGVGRRAAALPTRWLTRRQVPSRPCPTSSPRSLPRRPVKPTMATALLQLRHRLDGVGRDCRGSGGAGRPDLVGSPQRRRRAPVPDPRAAGRRRLDQRADQHEQGQRRRQHAEAARGHRRPAQRRLRFGRRAVPTAGSDLQSKTTGQIDSVAIESIHHAPPSPAGTPSPKPQPEMSFARAPTP